MDFLLSMLTFTGAITSVLIVITLVLFTQDKHQLSCIVFIGALGWIGWATNTQDHWSSWGIKEWWFVGIVGYLLIGSLVAVIKWILCCFQHATRIATLRETFIPVLIKKEKEHGTATPSQVRQLFASYWNDQTFGYKFTLDKYPRISTSDLSQFDNETFLTKSLTLSASDNVIRITSWVFQWPIVLICMCVEDLFIKLGRHISIMIDLLFSWVSRKLVNNSLRGL